MTDHALSSPFQRPSTGRPAAPRSAAPSKARPTHAGAEMVLWLVPTVLLALVLAVQTWGLVALTMAALPLVPLMFILFVWITLP